MRRAGPRRCPWPVWRRLALARRQRHQPGRARRAARHRHRPRGCAGLRARARTKALLEEIEIEAQVVRQRAAPLQRVAALRLCAAARAA
jgi:hypothetical protein